jgi:hypothetical protein
MRGLGSTERRWLFPQSAFKEIEYASGLRQLKIVAETHQPSIIVER